MGRLRQKETGTSQIEKRLLASNLALYVVYPYAFPGGMMNEMSSRPDNLPWSELLPGSNPARAMPVRMQKAFAYWNSLRRGRPMPSRPDLDPLDIAPLLSTVVLVDVIHSVVGVQMPDERAAADFRFRLVGTEVAARSARDYTGMRLADIPHMAPGSQFWQKRQDVVRSRRPLFSTTAYIGPDQAVRSCCDLLMPLSEDNDVVNMIFCFVSFETERRGFSHCRF